MSIITKAFALALVPRYFDFTDLSIGRRITWHAKGKGQFKVITNEGIERTFNNEFDAWVYAFDGCPDLMELLQSSKYMAQRGYAVRAQLLLALGEVDFAREVAAMHGEIKRIFDTAMAILPVKKVSKAAQRVFRINPTWNVSWLEMRVTVSSPMAPRPMQLGVRCIPSPFEENTWSVKLRHATPSNELVQDTQYRYDALVAELGRMGIIVKDVLNGTDFDL